MVPRTTVSRYKGREADIAAIRQSLNVRTVLTGTVIQLGNRLIVQTELVDTLTEAQIWGAKFNRNLDDIFDLQEELARHISEKLRLRLSPEEHKILRKRATEDPEAYKLLLKSKYHLNKWTPEGLQKGMEYARQAIEADPSYGAAYAALSISTVTRYLRHSPASGSLSKSEGGRNESLGDRRITRRGVHLARWCPTGLRVGLAWC